MKRTLIDEPLSPEFLQRPASKLAFFLSSEKEVTMNCGCTIQHPTCSVGKGLFSTLIQSQQEWENARGTSREHLWEQYAVARLAYIDHVHGWRQGDLRIRREGAAWKLERRHLEQWVFLLGMVKEDILRTWLKTHGFWRYAQIDGGERQDTLTGYYHQRDGYASQLGALGNKTATKGNMGQGMQGNIFLPLTDPSHLRLKGTPNAKVDLKIGLALLIGFSVGCSARPLTIVDRLHLQRKAVHWLLANGVQHLEAGERKMIDLLIDAAIAMRKDDLWQ